MTDTEYLIERFRNDYPYMADEIVDSKLHDKWTIDLIMKNGEKLRYDSIEGLSRTLKETSSIDDDEWKKALGRRIKRYIWSKGFTQQQLADRTGISQYLISRYINGYVSPSARNLKKIADALSCSADDLLNI